MWSSYDYLVQTAPPPVPSAHTHHSASAQGVAKTTQAMAAMSVKVRTVVTVGPWIVTAL